MIADAAAEGLVARSTTGKGGTEVAADEPLAEWEKELLATSEAAPAEAATTEA